MFQKNQRNLLNSFVPLEEPELGTTNYELPHTCMHSPTMFQFSSKITKPSSNSQARVLRKTMMMQKFFFQKPNKWNAARDVLQLEAQQQASITVKGKRENMKKTMNTGVVELLSHIKKRMHSRDDASASEPESEASVVNSAEVPTTNYEKMTVKQLVQEIKS